MNREIPNLVNVKALENYALYLIYKDGIEGEVDLSHIERKGFFEAWETDFKNFIVRGNILSWNENLEIDADALYLKLINKNYFEYARD